MTRHVASTAWAWPSIPPVNFSGRTARCRAYGPILASLNLTHGNRWLLGLGLFAGGLFVGAQLGQDVREPLAGGDAFEMLHALADEVA